MEHWGPQTPMEIVSPENKDMQVMFLGGPLVAQSGRSSGMLGTVSVCKVVIYPHIY